MQIIGAITLVVPDYDEAIAFYCKVLGFDLVEDTRISNNKRWVLVAPRRSTGTSLLLARAANADQRVAIDNQAGGRVFLFLYTSDFWRDYEVYKARGVKFLESPRNEPYGIVVVFSDPFGNKWDLIQKSARV